MQDVPSFTHEGLLPPGDYRLTLADLRASRLVVGREQSDWSHNDKIWRAWLVERLAVLAAQLWACDIDEIFIDGSFVEDKPHPSDIDGYFVCPFDHYLSGALSSRLNGLDPFQIWTWDPDSRRPYHGSSKRQLPMWHRYRVELYPHFPGLFTGLRDEFGNELEFPAAFRRARGSGVERGIIHLIR